MMCDDMSIDDTFPVEGLLPRKETEVLSFLTKYPEYDGRGVVIAVLDTGVDPAAAGLQLTTDGKRKIIDMVDPTGSGDVDTSEVVECRDTSEGVRGLSGRTLNIPDTWSNPSGTWHLGIKCVYDLYPKPLKDRLQKERKEKMWEPHHSDALARAHAALVDHQGKGGAEGEDIQAQVDILSSSEKRYSDYGPVYDCIVFHDGEMWRACVDTSQCGDLDKSILLTNYRDCHQYGLISSACQMNYVVNIHSEGKILEIVTSAGAHATHVAAIAAAHFPEERGRDGVAPGAQIISVKVGDSRLGSMETGTALTRSIKSIVNNRADLCNYSYGEATSTPGEGAIVDLIDELTEKYNVMFISSCGNNGPALSSVSCPGGSNNHAMGVSGYVSHQQRASNYSLPTSTSLTPAIQPFTWSARGPTSTGSLGISIAAPGSAITSVPKWTLKSSQLMNGTSMASPNACGTIALILSALKQEKVPYSAFSVRRAVENTARLADSMREDRLSAGHGLIQAEKAYEYCLRNHRDIDLRYHYKVSVTPVVPSNSSVLQGLQSKGVYLREPYESSRSIVDYQVSVTPQALDKIEGESVVRHEEKVEFEVRLALVCPSPHVSTPQHLQLSNTLRSFPLRIYPNQIPVGTASFTEVLAYDLGTSTSPSTSPRGPIFRIPITIISPENVGNTNYEVWHDNLSLVPGGIYRRFLSVPAGATYATLRVSLLDNDKCGKFVLHALQFQPLSAYSSHEFYKFVTLAEHSFMTYSFPVFGGHAPVSSKSTPINSSNPSQIFGSSTLEFCIAKWWSSSDTSVISYNLTFKGVAVSPSAYSPMTPPTLTHLASQGPVRLDLTAPLLHEEICPNITLRSYLQVLRPVTEGAKIYPLVDSRDDLPIHRKIYQLQLEYQFSKSKAGDVMVDCPTLSQYLYDSPLHSQLWMVFDANKQLVLSGDAFPQKQNYSAKLDKGEYVVKMQIRYDKRDHLTPFLTLPLHLHHKLSSPITLDIYSSYSSSITPGSKKLPSTLLLLSNHPLPIWISPIPDEKLPKLPSSCPALIGQLNVSRDEGSKRASSLPYMYMIGDGRLVKSLSNQFQANAKNNGVESVKSKSKNNGDKKSGCDDTNKSNKNTEDNSKTTEEKDKTTEDKDKTDEDKEKTGGENDDEQDVSGKSNDKYNVEDKGKEEVNEVDEDVKKFEDALRDLKTSWLSRLPPTHSDQIYSELCSAGYRERIQVKVGYLQQLESRCKGKKREDVSDDMLRSIIHQAELILDSIDESELLASVGSKTPTVDVDVSAGSLSSKVEIEVRKIAVLEAHRARGEAAVNLLERWSDDDDDESKGVGDVLTSTQLIEKLETSFSHIQRFIDPYDSKVVSLTAAEARWRGHLGREVRATMKQWEEIGRGGSASSGRGGKDAIALEEKLISLYEKLGWSHVVRFARDALHARYPQGYRLF